MTVVFRSFRILLGAVSASQLVDNPVVGAQFHLGAVCSAQPDDEHAAFRLPVPDVAQDVHLSALADRVARSHLDVHRVLLTDNSTTYDVSAILHYLRNISKKYDLTAVAG